MAIAYIAPLFHADDDSGAPAVGWKLYTYIAGSTTTMQDTYQDAAGAVPHTNPIVLNARGEAIIFIPTGTGYNFILKDANDVQKVVIPIPAIVDAAGLAEAAVDELREELADGTDAALGSGMVGYHDPIAPSYLQTVSDIVNGLPISLFRFLTPTQQTDFRNNGAGFDLTDRIQDAIDVVKVLECPYGTGLIAGSLELPYGVQIRGKSTHATIRPGTGEVTLGGGTVFHITGTTDSPFVYYSGNTFEGLTFYYPDQSRTDSTPTAYPATFGPNAAGVSEVLTNNVWRNCQFVNAYKWINALTGHLDFRFEELVGAPINRGIEIDGCGGTDILRKICMSYYYWCQFADNAKTYMQANATGISIGRCDALHMDRIYCGSMNVGTRFFQGSVNTVSGPYGSIVGLSLDGNNYGIYSEGTHGIGMNIVDIMSNSLSYDVEVPSGSATTSNLQFTGGKFWGPAGYAFHSAKSNGVFRFTGVDFLNGGINIGASASDLNVSNCRFTGGIGEPIGTTAQGNCMMLSNNQFFAAPSLNSPAATIYRFTGNTYLADASVGA